MSTSKEYLKVVLISNDKYGEGLENLSGANYITEKLYNYFKSIVTNPTENIRFLKNSNYSCVVNNLYEFIDKIGKQDNSIFLFYFCGHGKISSDLNQELILALNDTSATNYGSIGIKFNELVNKVKEANIKRFICIIDACHSGKINEARGGVESSIRSDDFVEGSVYISSNKGTLKSYEVDIEQKKVPWFSYCFWKTLTSKEINGKSYYSIDDIFKRTKKFMSEKRDVNMEPGNTYRNELYNEKIFPIITTNNNSVPCVPDVIDWRITSKCDNQCPICYACNNNEDLSDNELTENQIDEIINKLSQVNCKSICVSGGEPTISGHLEKILRKLREKGYSIFLSTNGYNYMEYCDEIEPYIDKLSMPLDGYDGKSNECNGRNLKSFSKVKEILDYYENNMHDFPIKISTVLTRKNSKISHLSKILDLLKNYNISFWKIYEFIPENRGRENFNSYSLYTGDIIKIRNWVSRINDCRFKIELVEKEKRDAAYFIIKPNGDVIIPIEDNKAKIVNEKLVGNILNNDLNFIIDRWNEFVNIENYISNIKLRKINQSYFLKPNDKKLLYNFISTDDVPSVKDLSRNLHETEEDIKNQLDKLYEYRLIKNIIPVVNLKLFGIETFLATLYFSKYVSYPDGYLEEYLCYNAYIGWVTKCENNTYRVAIFAKDEMIAKKVLQKIQKDLNNELEYNINGLKCSYAIGERELFLNTRENELFYNNIKYNSIEQRTSEKVKLTEEEFYVLMQIENIRKPLKENIDNKLFFKTFDDIYKNISSLKNKNVIEQLLVSLDTRLLGYQWYIIFAQIDFCKEEKLIEYLRTNFNNITHINSLKSNFSKWNLDFELHVTSYAEINIIISKIMREFNDSITVKETLKIIRECKFTFLPHYVLDIILKNYVLENREGSENC